ncbi:LacI family DNA-binding transcriptional regulator [Microbacterium sp. MPKO10]|uniref:LacI family DNA-binding transcriptional regulator n=1 Tax=Microbacterium sp. MPKO10 TaxID=2989818 RepID=UPI002235A778|nr:LacI family DNA-binding transcriptional regulator [Microbacterium sp. MPKO10]MCW4459965.1 LacI family transcriptional regulator [Microbacterium sp. MPKO10]
MTSQRPRRMTQRRIAELAGVSQAAVSLVLSGRTDTTTRLSDATRQRVLDVLHETNYEADPAARSLAGKSNNIVGVFTYESAFPAEASDFYAPLLTGVESAAEELGADLLMFTSSRTHDGPRRLLREGSRLRLADGCVLLGRHMDAGELARLVELEYPFVAVGRRDGDARVPYVGADYASAVGELVDLAVARGHTKLTYAALPFDAESTRDRLAGFVAATRKHGVSSRVVTRSSGEAEKLARDVDVHGSTVVFVEDPVEADRLVAHIESEGRAVPRDLSVVALGEHARRDEAARDVTRLVAPRTALGAEAVRLLARIMSGEVDESIETRVLLPCSIVEGSTLADRR